jgi:hypothetical protein
VKKTKYFEQVILKRRSYIKVEWCENIIVHHTKKETQQDGRIRYWGYITELGKFLRVVTLEDGVTIHNAFPDRNFRIE